LEAAEEQKGYLDIAHFDRAILECLGADFIPSAGGDAVGPNYSPDPDLGFGIETPDGDQARDPSDDPNCKFKAPRRQADVPGVTGSGVDGRVPVIMNTPEESYNRYLVPGIRVHRSSIDFDPTRHHSHLTGHKYRIPSNNGDRVELKDGRVGWTAYKQREHADPYIFTYDIEVRARRALEAQTLRRYVSKRLRHQTFVPVYDSLGDVSYFNIFRDAIMETSQYIDTLNRFYGYMMTYRLQAEIDDYDEVEVIALTSEPQLNIRQITEET